MKPFDGFPAGRTRFTPLPDLFFSELLGRIDDLAELKLTLFMFWFLNRQRGYPRYMTLAELEGEGELLSALPAAAGVDPCQVLRAAVERAVSDGLLLCLTIADEAGDIDYLFMNTAPGRRAVRQVRAGELVLEAPGIVREPHIAAEQPTIYQLYEQNIGLLQPMLAEELRQAADDYPEAWIVDAFRIAAEQNARNWRYVRAVLERWARDGKDDGASPARGRRRASSALRGVEV